MTASDYWHEQGAVLSGDEGGPRRVAHFGDPEGEAEAASAAAAAQLVPLLGVTLLRLTGADRAAFLHGQLSNEVEGLGPGRCNPTLQLTPKGQAVGEGTLCVREAELLLAVDDDRGAAVRASLEAHVIFDEVTIEDLGGAWSALTVQGPEAAATVAPALGHASVDHASVDHAPVDHAPVDHAPVDHAPVDGSAREGQAMIEAGGRLLLPRRRSPAGGVDVLVPAESLAETVAALRREGAALAGERALALMRVLGGVPSVAVEGAGGALPQELGLESAVSYRKGCYLGQEIMARIEARGAVRKGLARLRLAPADASGPVPAPEELEGRALTLEGREVGRLGTVVRLPQGGLAALAVLRRELSSGAPVEARAAGGARVACEPWPTAVEA